MSVPYSQCQLLLGKYEYPPEGDSTEPQVQKYVSILQYGVSFPNHAVQCLCDTYNHVQALLQPEGRLLDLETVRREHRTEAAQLRPGQVLVCQDTVAED